MNPLLNIILSAILLASFLPASAADTSGADTWLPTLFGNNMMFQRNKPIKVWGFGQPGRRISATLSNDTDTETVTAAINSEGRFDVEFGARGASFAPYTLTISDGDATTTISGILVGEIWVAAGQSNMALRVNGLQEEPRDEILADIDGDGDRLRIFIEPQTAGVNLPYDTQKSLDGAKWYRGDSQSGVGQCSAVGYYMTKGIQQKLAADGDPTPVGVLCTARDGAPIETFLSRDEVESPEFAPVRDKLKEFGLYYDRSTWTGREYIITGYYNTRIAPLAGFNVAGMIWYQGEANWQHPEIYADELRALRHCWSRTFGFGNEMIPMVFNQLGPWVTEVGIINVSEAMTDAWRTMDSDGRISHFPIYDTDFTHTGNLSIHPTNKKPVGLRYVTAVYNTVYDPDATEYTCPVVRDYTIGADGVITVNLDHTGEGLRTLDGSGDVIGFTAACADGVHVNVPAKISDDGTSVILTTTLHNPLYFTYAFRNRNMAANLCNSIGLPAAPYRNDRESRQQLTANIDWLEMDSPQIWGYVWEPESLDKGWSCGFNDAWSAEGAQLDFVGDGQQHHGKAALKVTATVQAQVSANVDSYSIPQNNGISANKSLRVNLEGVTALSFFIKNPDNTTKAVTLHITAADGTTYSSTARIASDSDYTLVLFPFENVKHFGIIRNLWFTIPAGILYFDHGRILPAGYIRPTSALTPVTTGPSDSPADFSDPSSGANPVPERWFTPSGTPVNGCPTLPGLYISTCARKLLIP